MAQTEQQIDLLFRYRVTDGDGFARYLEMVLPATAEEPYVLEYELFRREDGTILQHERYVDEAAIGRHLEHTAAGQKVWGESTELIDITMIGPLSQEFLDQWSDLPDLSVYRRFRDVPR